MIRRWWRRRLARRYGRNVQPIPRTALVALLERLNADERNQ